MVKGPLEDYTIMMKTVLDCGYVKLEDFMANDLSVVNSARVSFGKHKTQIDDKDKGLINFLMREKHGTPFEHNAFMFHIKAPIFVAREWMRHRIGSFNEYSLRYSEAIPDFYTPKLEDMRKQIGKPGAYSFEQLQEEHAQSMLMALDTAQRGAYDIYQNLLQAGLAKELARTVIPVGFYTEFYWTVNARSLMNFISLRGAETAQYEIREYSNAVEEIFGGIMPITYEAFKLNGRVAP